MNTKVNLAGVELKNPVMTASGTFGSGAEYSEFVDLNELGAVVTKVWRMYRGRETQPHVLQKLTVACSMQLDSKIRELMYFAKEIFRS